MLLTLYILAAIVTIGGKLNNYNIKNHPLDIRVKRDLLERYNKVNFLHTNTPTRNVANNENTRRFNEDIHQNNNDTVSVYNKESEKSDEDKIFINNSTNEEDKEDSKQFNEDVHLSNEDDTTLNNKESESARSYADKSKRNEKDKNTETYIKEVNLNNEYIPVNDKESVRINKDTSSLNIPTADEGKNTTYGVNETTDERDRNTDSYYDHSNEQYATERLNEDIQKNKDYMLHKTSANANVTEENKGIAVLDSNITALREQKKFDTDKTKEVNSKNNKDAVYNISFGYGLNKVISKETYNEVESFLKTFYAGTEKQSDIKTFYEDIQANKEENNLISNLSIYGSNETVTKENDSLNTIYDDDLSEEVDQLYQELETKSKQDNLMFHLPAYDVNETKTSGSKVEYNRTLKSNYDQSKYLDRDRSLVFYLISLWPKKENLSGSYDRVKRNVSYGNYTSEHRYPNRNGSFRALFNTRHNTDNSSHQNYVARINGTFRRLPARNNQYPLYPSYPNPITNYNNRGLNTINDNRYPSTSYNAYNRQNSRYNSHEQSYIPNYNNPPGHNPYPNDPNRQFDPNYPINNPNLQSNTYYYNNEPKRQSSPSYYNNDPYRQSNPSYPINDPNSQTNTYYPINDPNKHSNPGYPTNDPNGQSNTYYYNNDPNRQSNPTSQNGYNENNYNNKNNLINSSEATSTENVTESATTSTTPNIVQSCFLCGSFGCPQFFKRIGHLCISSD